MDDRRRTISSEEQMIGEALMRVSNTLEAQRLTKSLDYQEKLRSRSNIRLIIAIICLFTAMMMMMISGALLFVLWRYADPILDIVVPFAKGMTGDFATIWDGLVETLSYVPVMVEQLTRLLEQVIIMLEAVNSFDLAGVMSYLSEMLNSLKPSLDLMMDSINSMLSSFAGIIGTLESEGLDGVIRELFGADAEQAIKDMMGAVWASVSDMSAGISEMAKSGAMTNLLSGTGDLLNGTASALSEVGSGLSGIDSADVAKVVDGGKALLDGTSNALTQIGSGLSGINSNDVKDVVDAGSEALAGASELFSGLGHVMTEIGGSLQEVDSIGDLLGLLS